MTTQATATTFGVLIACLFLTGLTSEMQADDYEIDTIWVVTDSGGRVDWSPDGNLIAFDRESPSGVINIYTMFPDGLNVKNLTSGFKSTKNKGQPAWHPSGDYIVIQVENEYSLGTGWEGPALGINNDLWIMRADGSEYWELTHNPSGWGALHPHFSHDGSKLFWAERYGPGDGSPWGNWRLKLADFVVDSDEPRLENAKEMQPRGVCWYESSSFSPDDMKLYFTSMIDGGFAMDVFSCNLNGDSIVNLTNRDDELDELAQFPPSGDKITFVSSRFFEWNPPDGFATLKTELYIMDTDGANVKRLTYFNEGESKRYLVGDHSWSPLKNRLVTECFNVEQEKYDILMIEFVKPDPGIEETVTHSTRNTRNARNTPYLEQITPNPFGRVTTIYYQIPASDRVALNIYDATGRHVQTLVDEVQSTGEHSIIWDAEGLSVGVYFCRLEMNDTSNVQKMLLLR